MNSWENFSDSVEGLIHRDSNVVERICGTAQEISNGNFKILSKRIVYQMPFVNKMERNL